MKAGKYEVRQWEEQLKVPAFDGSLSSEESRKVVEVTIEEDECASCEALGSPPRHAPEGTFIIMESKNVVTGETELRIHNVVSLFGVRGWFCAGISEEDARKEISNVQTDLLPIPESEQKKPLPPSFLLDAVEMLVSPASWAAKMGHKLGSEMRAKKEAESKGVVSTPESTNPRYFAECRASGMTFDSSFAQRMSGQYRCIRCNAVLKIDKWTNEVPRHEHGKSNA